MNIRLKPVVLVVTGIVVLLLAPRYITAPQNQSLKSDTEFTPKQVTSFFDEGPTKTLDTARIVSYSTPESHDQLLISTSLSGTNIDGALKADERGHLVLDLGVRDFFDYFLSTADEIGPEAAIDEIIRYANSYLPEPAKAQALGVLESYLRYKKYEFSLEQTPLDTETLSDERSLAIIEQSFLKLRTERKKLFSPKAEKALFGLEDINADLTLATLKIEANKKLSDEEKRLAANNLMQQLPQALSQSKVLDVHNEVQQDSLNKVLSTEVDTGQIYQKLESHGYSKTQADQIVMRHQQQTDFNKRYAEYRKVAIVDTENKEALRKKHFPLPEDQTQAALRDISEQ